MSRKLPRVVSQDNGAKRGVVILDYEEDARGRRAKSKPYRKPKKATSTIIPPAVSASWMDDLDEPDEDTVPAEGDFIGAELDLDDVDLDQDESTTGQQKVSGVHYIIIDDCA